MTIAPEDLIRLSTAIQSKIKSLQSDLDDLKAQLQAHFELGTISDKLSTPFGTASLVTRSTWSYSPAVKALQDLEQLDGIATKKTSSSWTIKAATSNPLDF
jgi:hypothetical protein